MVMAKLERSAKFRAKTAGVQNVIADAVAILGALGIPLSDLTSRRIEKMAMAFLAVGGVVRTDDWRHVLDASSDDRNLTTRKIIQYNNENFEEAISSGSYDDIRRKDLKRPVLAQIVIPTKPDAATNDGSRGYALAPDYAAAIRLYGTSEWSEAVAAIVSTRGTLGDKLVQTRSSARLEVTFPSGDVHSFKWDKHNELQKAIIEQFLPVFGHTAEVLYVGDAESRHKVFAKERLAHLGISDLSHGKLPDVIAYSRDKGWLYLIEAVQECNPITPERLLEMKIRSQSGVCPVVYVTAFHTLDDFRLFASQIAWETEVWIAARPEHLVHYNGDKFLGPYRPDESVAD